MTEQEALFSALHAERFDPFRNEVTIFGVRYSIDLFRHLGVAKLGDWVRIEKREGEVLTLRLASGGDWPTERASLLSLLREVEWEAGTALDDGDGVVDLMSARGSCPACHATESEGHAPDCRLAAALKEAP